MNVRVRAGIVTLCGSVLVSACDPVAAVYVRQSLRPAPAAACVSRALVSSPQVSQVRAAAWSDSNYTVTVRDVTAAVGSRDAEVEVTRTAPDSATLSVTFHLPGKMTWNVGAEESHHLGMLANAIAHTVLAACAPDAPGPVSCRVEGMWWTKSCNASG
jgi:hypothetical protein